MTGPLYEHKMFQLPNADEPHLVPSGYWKVLAIRDGQTIQVAAFTLDKNAQRRDEFCTELKAVDDVEKLSELEFFHGLSDAEQEQLESGRGTLAVELGCPLPQ